MNAPTDAIGAILANAGAERFKEFSADAGSEPLDFARFAKLPSVQRWLGEFDALESALNSPEAVAEYLALLYVGFRYWSAGSHAFALDRATLEPRLAGPVNTPPSVPRGACLLRFPDRWFWGQIGPDQPHEPLHGILLCGPAGTPTPRDEFTVLALFGVHEHRDGASQVSLTVTGAEFVAAFSEMRHPPFAPLMEGGERAGFRSIASPAELLHLTHVALALTGR